ncbi:hypothetical protein ACU686_24180 [Yinghuangia aomiensis]
MRAPHGDRDTAKAQDGGSATATRPERRRRPALRRAAEPVCEGEEVVVRHHPEPVRRDQLGHVRGRQQRPPRFGGCGRTAEHPRRQPSSARPHGRGLQLTIRHCPVRSAPRSPSSWPGPDRV